MIIEKDYDTTNMHTKLEYAIKVACEQGEYSTISFQRYWDIDAHSHLWDFSFSEEVGKSRLGRIEIEAVLCLFRKCDSLDEEDFLVKELADFIRSIWKGREWDLNISTEYYQDSYDMYGVRMSDFA